MLQASLAVEPQELITCISSILNFVVLNVTWKRHWYVPNSSRLWWKESWSSRHENIGIRSPLSMLTSLAKVGLINDSVASIIRGSEQESESICWLRRRILNGDEKSANPEGQECVHVTISEGKYNICQQKKLIYCYDCTTLCGLINETSVQA